MEEPKKAKSANLRIIKTNLFIIVFFIAIWGIWHVLKTKIIYPNDAPVNIEVPSVYSNLSVIDSTTLLFTDPESKEEIRFKSRRAAFSIKDFEDIAYAHPEGISLRFKKKFNGKVLYGLYPDEDLRYPQAVYFKRSADIVDGRALIPIKEELTGKYDIANWESHKKGSIGYRIIDENNNIIYTASLNFKGTGPFEPLAAIQTGPFISNLTDTSATIWFTTSSACKSSLGINDLSKDRINTGKRHVYQLQGLIPDNEYPYYIHIDGFSYKGVLRTAPSKDSLSNFTFAFASDSRASLPVGESDIYGHNGYIMKKLAAMIASRNVALFQFTGDMIDGYENECGSQNLQYENWFKTLSPFMHSTAINIGFGNHESFAMTDDPLSVNAFPFATRSGEKLFADQVENPLNGPISEDNSKLDPNKNAVDFPSYKENVYSYRYGNTGFVVLNSNYLYTPKAKLAMKAGGNIHGYIMDNQLKWLKSQLIAYELDITIQHVFVTIHTPAFPIGGHAKNDMWYYGDNSFRPMIANQLAEKGIIERRDEFLNLMVNKSTKVRALLTGDEHNYSRLIVTDSTSIYPDNWEGSKLSFQRPFTQIVNGSAGAPYYAREKLPWYDDVVKFTPQFAVVFFHIKGNSIELEVVNPDTYESIEKIRFY